MHKEYEKLFSRLKPVELSAGLFERVILAIKREQELQQRKKLFGFLSFLIVSLAATPFSWALLAGQIKESGIVYFISAAASDINIALAFWQDFGSAILESLPIMGIMVFTLNIILVLLTLRLFLDRSRRVALRGNKLLFNYQL